MVKKIVFFNHKGGVSKTTSTFNIGWKLAEMGHRVLLVDADPQCNLTSVFLGEKFDAYYDDADTCSNNIMAGVHPAFAGTPDPIRTINCPNHSFNRDLYLLPGHMNLSEYDPQLTFAINAPVTLTAMQNLPGSFNQLIVNIAEKYDIEYALIDLNPGLSTLNQILFVSSDAFIIPANPDIFCVMAIKSLSRILPQWINWKNINIHNFTHATYPMPNGTPRFIGEIIQRFNIRKGVAAAIYRPLIDTIKSTVKDFLIPALSRVSMTFPLERYNDAHISKDFCLAEIKDFATLGQQYQKTGIPVFAIPDDKLDTTGIVKDQLIQSRNAFNEQFTTIANNITALLSQYGKHDYNI